MSYQPVENFDQIDLDGFLEAISSTSSLLINSTSNMSSTSSSNNVMIVGSISNSMVKSDSYNRLVLTCEAQKMQIESQCQQIKELEQEKENYRILALQNPINQTTGKTKKQIIENCKICNDICIGEWTTTEEITLLALRLYYEKSEHIKKKYRYQDDFLAEYETLFKPCHRSPVILRKKHQNLKIKKRGFKEEVILERLNQLSLSY